MSEHAFLSNGGNIMSNIYNIDKNAHYFVLMHPLECYGPIVITSSLNREKWVECIIVEERYKVDDGYKVELRALDENYGREIFYQEDFISWVKFMYTCIKMSISTKSEVIHYYYLFFPLKTSLNPQWF